MGFDYGGVYHQFSCFWYGIALSRIVSNNLWMSIGFHLAWLEMVRYVVVPSQYAFIEIEYLSVWGNYMVTIGSVIIGIILLIVWSLRSKNRIDWNGIEPDLPPDSNPATKEALPAQSV